MTAEIRTIVCFECQRPLAVEELVDGVCVLCKLVEEDLDALERELDSREIAQGGA